MQLTREQTKRVTLFIQQWLEAVVPGIRAARVVYPNGVVEARDSLGWRAVGTTQDFVALARALERL